MATPKLRFKEFNEDWSKTTLSDIAEINPPSSSLPDKFIYIDLESVKNGRLLAENNIELKNAPSRAQRLLQKDDVLFQVVRPYQQNNLYFEKEGSYVASTGYAQIRANANSSFLYYILHEENFLNNVINRCTGTSYPAINSKDLSSIEVYTTSLEEQTKIATFLSAVDTKIDALTQSHELLTEYKKGMMQQIFNQKLRFKGNDGGDFEDWQEKKIGDFCSLINGRSYKKSEWEKEGVPVIRLQNLTGSGQDYYYSNLKLPSHQYCYNNDLLYMWSATFGPVFWQGEKAIFHYHIWKIETDDSLMSKNYMYYLLDEMTEKMKASLNGSTMLHVTKSGMEKTVKPIPSLPEQTKIANFLTALDQKINNAADQVEQAKTWKKGLLQQMFV